MSSSKRSWEDIAAELDEALAPPSTASSQRRTSARVTETVPRAPEKPDDLVEHLDVNVPPWVPRAQNAFRHIFEHLGKQTRDVVVHTACTGTGAATLSVQVWPLALLQR